MGTGVRGARGWKRAWAVGLRGERLVARLVRVQWPDVVHVQRIAADLVSQREGDLRITHASGLTWTCEVKHDKQSEASGQLAVEQARLIGHAYIGTGLSTSTARAWAFVTNGTVIFALPEQLRALIASKRMDGTLREARVGDGKRTLCAFVPIDEVAALSGSCVVNSPVPPTGASPVGAELAINTFCTTPHRPLKAAVGGTTSGTTSRQAQQVARGNS
ncbi:MAG: hypothetical protein U0640_08015 [Phycisphaerales bacterium]